MWERLFENFDYMFELTQVIRIVFAGLCGFALGFERMKREKEAGVRTHSILAVAVASITTVSMSFESDTARIAAQIVSGVGFLGAGIIFFRGEYLHGLTTAAGIWATVGIGMASANGMYIIAIAVTLLIIFAQSLLHSKAKLFGAEKYKVLKIRFVYSDELAVHLSTFFHISQFSRFKALDVGGNLVADAVVKTSIDCDSAVLTKLMRQFKDIESIERLDVR